MGAGLFFCAAVAVCAVARADDFEGMRRSMLDRPRTLVYNTDGCDMLYYPDGRPETPEEFKKVRLAYTKGTKIRTVSYCPVSAGFGHFTCPGVGDCLTNDMTSVAPDSKAHNATLAFARQGTDALAMAVEYCRENGLEPFLGIRVNDTHDQGDRPDRPYPLFPRFKRDNPGCLMGKGPAKGERPPYCTWSAVDFAHEKVRARMKEFVAAFLGKYDVDGIEYDFMRHAQLFKSVAMGGEATEAELETMTSLMRELRAIAEAAGRRRRRPVLVAVRVPDSAGFCRAMGIDLERWMAEKLFDMEIAAGYFQFNPWRPSAELAHRHGIKFYASLDESRIGQAKPPFGMIPGRNSAAAYAARIAAAMASGCDGAYLFNLEYDALSRIGKIDPLATEGLDKLYFATERGSGGYRPWEYVKDAKRFYTLPRIDPAEPLPIADGVPVSFMLAVGDDLSVPAARRARATVEIMAHGARSLSLACNGRTMPDSAPASGRVSFPIPPEALRKGDNAFSVTARGGSEMRLVDFVLRIAYPVK